MSQRYLKIVVVFNVVLICVCIPLFAYILVNLHTGSEHDHAELVTLTQVDEQVNAALKQQANVISELETTVKNLSNPVQLSASKTQVLAPDDLVEQAGTDPELEAQYRVAAEAYKSTLKKSSSNKDELTDVTSALESVNVEPTNR